jgi:hypothetical protein
MNDLMQPTMAFRQLLNSMRLDSTYKSPFKMGDYISRSCGHNDFSQFNKNDLSTLDYQMHQLTGIHYAGVQF